MADALRQLQGSMIESVEVITNPSARYEAEGEAGIINIVLKKENQLGVNGSFEVSGGYPHNYGASYNLNLRRKKVNLFSSYGINYNKRPGEGYIERYVTRDTVFHDRTNRNHTRGGLSTHISLGADVFFSPKDVLTFSGLYKYGNGNNLTKLTYTNFDTLNNVIGNTYRQDNENEKENNIEANVSYRKKYDEKDREWNTNLNFNLSDDTENSNISQNSIPSETSSNTEDEWNLLFQSDYVQPFGINGKFEMGLKSTLRDIDNDFSVSEPNRLAVIDSLSDKFTYRESITAGYLMAGNKTGQFSYQGA
ncbi:MAG: outer membrane beta-barrel protein [Bacteroidales bacterium]|nr:outer membrane beta-barrel protein [Bacteroidales bacterium]